MFQPLCHACSCVSHLENVLGVVQEMCSEQTIMAVQQSRHVKSLGPVEIPLDRKEWAGGIKRLG